MKLRCLEARDQHQTMQGNLHPATIANNLIFGLIPGTIFCITSTASILNVLNGPFAYIFGFACGAVEAITNGALTPFMMRELFTFNPLLWGVTALTFDLLAGMAALPVTESLIQSLETFEENGIDINTPWLANILGNAAILVLGTYLAIGISRFISNIISFIRWKVFDNHAQKYVQMRNYLEDKRSVDEYRAFLLEPEKFLQHKFSWPHLGVLSVSTIIALTYGIGIGPEMANGLNDSNSPQVASILNLFDLIPLKEAARTREGGMVLTSIIDTLLFTPAVATSIRLFFRDLTFIAWALSQKEFTLAAKGIGFPIFTLLSCVTAFYMSVKSEDSPLLTLLTTASVFFINYSGPRLFFYNKLLPLLSCHSCRKDNEPEFDINHVDPKIIPVLNENQAKQMALKRLNAVIRDDSDLIANQKHCGFFSKLCNRSDREQELLDIQSEKLLQV